MNVHSSLKLFAYLLLAGLLAAAAPDNRAIAARLAKAAKKAENSGQTVRAYLLFSEAAARDPQNITYRENRNGLASAAKLLTKANVQTADVGPDVAAAEKEAAAGPPPIERIGPAEWRNPELRPIPHLQFDPGLHDFDLPLEATSLAEQVSTAYGVRALVDRDVDRQKLIHFELHGADFRTALEALTAATNTFQYPVTSTDAFIARDTESKRNEQEQIVSLTFP